MAATRRRTGDCATCPFATSHPNASWTATQAPVIAAVRVPPSACRTSQSTRIVNSPKAKLSTIARTLRPMSRWISWVRPPNWLRSRAVLVRVARGSIAYSAVIHPSPLPFLQAGTVSSTDAAHSTRVSPNEMRHDPSAYGTAPRSSVTVRSMPAPRDSLGVRSAVTEALDGRSRGIPRRERNDHDLTAAGSNHVGADDGVRRIVPAFDDDIRAERLHQLEGRVLIEHRHGVDALEGREDVGTLALAADRPISALEPLHGRITIHPDDEAVTAKPRTDQDIDMARMEQIEYAVREHHAAALAFTPRNECRPGHHFPARVELTQ